MFFEKFREALARLPDGLIRAAPAATPAQIAAAQAAMGGMLPASYVAFLGSFDGADLFHEAVVLAGAGDAAPLRLIELNAVPAAHKGGVDSTPNEPLFAEVAGGDHYAFRADGGIVRIRSESEERWHAGGDFANWLDGVLAYHRVLYGPDGEFAPEAFEPDGSEVIPPVALKQTERALRLCPDSAEWHHERGVALRRLDRLTQAKQAFATAATLDPRNPWPRFDLGRVALELGPAAAREAGAAFEEAAVLDGGDAAGRLWTWAARAAQLEAAPARLEACRRQALACEPALAEQLRRARDAAQHGGDADEIAEAEALLEALEAPIQTGRMRLPVVRAESEERVRAVPATPAHRAPPPVRHRPAHAPPPRSAGPRPGRRR